MIKTKYYKRFEDTRMKHTEKCNRARALLLKRTQSNFIPLDLSSVTTERFSGVRRVQNTVKDI